MSEPDDMIRLTLPRPIWAGIVGISAAFEQRMHDLLEKNTDGAISEKERKELEALVRIAQFEQVVTLAMLTSVQPKS